MTSLFDQISSIKASTTLNKNTKEYGKKFLVDNNPDTCWQSDKATNNNQTIIYQFDDIDHDSIIINKFKISFQGGFVAKKVTCSVSNQKTVIHPTDTNQAQEFLLSGDEVLKVEEGDKLKILMEDFSDFYGRVIVYHLEPIGECL